MTSHTKLIFLRTFFVVSLTIYLVGCRGGEHSRDFKHMISSELYDFPDLPDLLGMSESSKLYDFPDLPGMSESSELYDFPDLPDLLGMSEEDLKAYNKARDLEPWKNFKCNPSSGSARVEDEKKDAKHLEVNSDYLYESEDINAILSSRVQEIFGKESKFGDISIEVLAAVDNLIKNSLQKVLKADKEHYSQNMINKKGDKDLPKGRILLVPYNLGNAHWAGLLIEVNKDQKVVRTKYMDSLKGTSRVDQNVKDALKKVYGVSEDTLKIFHLFKQNDATSCGAYAIENLIGAIDSAHDCQEKVIPITTEEIRNKHLKCLEEHSKDFFKDFYLRQKENNPTVVCIEKQLNGQFSQHAEDKNVQQAKDIKKYVEAFQDDQVKKQWYAAFENKEEYEDEIKRHMDAMRKEIKTIGKTIELESDKKTFQDLLCYLFDFTPEEVASLDQIDDKIAEKKLRVDYQSFLSVGGDVISNEVFISDFSMMDANTTGEEDDDKEDESNMENLAWQEKTSI